MWLQKSDDEKGSQDVRLDGQKAFITGAGQGIGEAIALKLAEQGWEVAIIEINPE